ncbi:hypothetical protein TWF694_000327 [Orbilia ellipsospora]|uniref:Mitochondrial adapter protein MCP1 transmembrane domain-containing protein n=1 Tax=Orbilia ellipsospora TaxID=2528407 RepID=A0AAV9XQU3_9PEZI
MPIHIPFLLHSLLELPPSIILLLTPLSFIPPSPPQDIHPQDLKSDDVAVANNAITPILRQYGGILLSSSVFSFLLAITPNQLVLPMVHSTLIPRWRLHEVTAVALAGYHALTIHRAYGRIRTGEKAFGLTRGVLGGPGVHLTLHTVVGGSLVWFGFFRF